MNVKKLISVLIVMTIIFITILVKLFNSEQEFISVFLKNQDQIILSKVILAPSEEPLANPIDIAVDSEGQIYVTDSDQHRIQVFNKDGKYLYRFGKYGKGRGELNYPVGIVIDSKDNLYIAELYNQRISVFSKKGKYKNSFSFKNQTGSIGIATAIAIDQNDQLYIIDKTDNTIKKLSTNGKKLLTFSGPGTQKGEIQYPLGLTVANKGEIVVSDTGNSRIQVFDNNGKYKLSFTGEFGTPSGIALDKNDRIFFTDPLNSKLFITTYWGEMDNTIGEIGSKSEQLYVPEGLEIKNNQLYIADKGNNRIIVYKIEGSK